MFRNNNPRRNENATELAKTAHDFDTTLLYFLYCICIMSVYCLSDPHKSRKNNKQHFIFISICINI